MISNAAAAVVFYGCVAGPSNQACVGGPDRPTSSSLASLYPALEYRAIMQEMSPTAFGEGKAMPTAVAWHTVTRIIQLIHKDLNQLITNRFVDVT